GAVRIVQNQGSAMHKYTAREFIAAAFGQGQRAGALFDQAIGSLDGTGAGECVIDRAVVHSDGRCGSVDSHQIDEVGAAAVVKRHEVAFLISSEVGSVFPNRAGGVPGVGRSTDPGDGFAGDGAVGDDEGNCAGVVVGQVARVRTRKRVENEIGSIAVHGAAAGEPDDRDNGRES